MFTLRRLSGSDTDHELIWPIVSSGCVAMAVVWLHWQLPIPRCGFHLMSGLPCPTCGATRCVIALLHGNVAQAWQFNPLIFVALACVAAFDVYALVALASRGRRVRLTRLRWPGPVFVRCAFVAVLALNWAYLIHRGDI